MNPKPFLILRSFPCLSFTCGRIYVFLVWWAILLLGGFTQKSERIAMELLRHTVSFSPLLCNAVTTRSCSHSAPQTALRKPYPGISDHPHPNPHHSHQSRRRGRRWSNPAPLFGRSQFLSFFSVLYRFSSLCSNEFSVGCISMCLLVFSHALFLPDPFA